MPEAFTADGRPRPNAVVLPPIPYSIGANARVGVLNDIAQALKDAGSAINPIDRSASYNNSGVTQRVNDIIVAANALGATPVLKPYISLDYNGFSSAINQIVAAIQAIP